MRPFRRLAFASLLTACAVAALPHGRAEASGAAEASGPIQTVDDPNTIDDASAAAIRSTVEGQLQAFRRDDAAAAYGFAAPNIQQVFPTDERFMEMVKQGYPPVYRSKSFTFEAAREIGGSIGQEVRIVDQDNGHWLALYTMEKQPDGSWKISGCRIIKAPDQSV